MDSPRVLGILLRKNWLVRRRHWMSSLVGQILVPVGLIFGARLLFDDVSRNLTSPIADHAMHTAAGILKESTGPNLTITYAPANEFVNRLMLRFRECWTKKMTLFGFYTEERVVAFDANSTVKRPAIIFDPSTDRSTKHFRYKIRGELPSLGLYKYPDAGDIINYYIYQDNYVQIQICLDKSFIESKINASSIRSFPRMFIQRMPDPVHSEKLLTYHLQYLVYTVLMIVIFTIPHFIEMSLATDEKFGGIHVLMSMNGISNTLNFLSWIVSGLLLLSIFCVMTMLVMFIRPDENSYALYNYIDPLVLFTFFTVHNLHMMAFGIHISAYFTKPIIVTFAYTIVNVTVIVFRICVLGDNDLYIVRYVGIIFPNMFLYETMSNIRSYIERGLCIQWAGLFDILNPATKNEISIGMTLILSIVGLIFHFSLSVYVYAINPGKHGVGKHPFFLFKGYGWNKNCSSTEYSTYDAPDKKLFEFTTTYPIGIQIRNLQKFYNIGVFNKQKAHALRGVSVDLYQGQITSLLGHNGAGKSTLMSILTGMISATGGTVMINSKNLRDSACEILKDVGLCAQEDMYFSCLTVIEQLEFFAMVKKRNREHITNLLRKLKLFNVKNALPNDLSEDQKRKLCLGMAFAGDPSILILDEPTSRLDHENKRLVWNILLEMKGRKTILLSTHDMQEADFLADRVAIIHEGRLRSYGTPLFLKQMITGQNNIEVALSIERWSDPHTIRKQIHSEAQITKSQDRKMIVSVPTSVLLASLDNLEKRKTDLGVCSYSLLLVSLEQAFLKITQGNDNAHESVSSSKKKLTGTSMYIQSVRALLLKNACYALKESITLGIQILTVFIALLTVFIPLATSNVTFKHDQIMHINLGMYNNSSTLYTSADKTIGERYKSTCQMQGGHSVEITNESLYSELTRRAKENLLDYNRDLIAAAEFNETANGLVVNAFYSNEIFNSLPISINLITNAIIKYMLGVDYSISLSKERFPNTDAEPIKKKYYYMNLARWLAVIFVMPVYFLMATFVIHPARESSQGLKQLQKMTGVSGFTYWGAMFLSDMMQYTFLLTLLIIGLVCVDHFLRLRIFEAKEIVTQTLLLMLFAINSLPLVYIISFMKIKSNTLVKLLTFTPIGIGTIEVIFILLNIDLHDFFTFFRGEWRPFYWRIFLLVPNVSFFHAQIAFNEISLRNTRCRRLSNRFYDVNVNCESEDYCCKLNCYNGVCQTHEPYFDNPNFSFDECIKYLCITPVFYFCLLAIFEARLFQRIKIKYTIQDSVYFPLDEQVLREKSIIFKIIQALSKKGTYGTEQRETPPDDSNSKVLLTYELRKHYKKIRAVEDVSFSADHGECFGILGVNRAGKSVTFRMLTGEEIPDYGIILMKDECFKNNKKFFLSQIGYCPQQEAIIKCMNSYDHLRLFARLRGVPEKLIETEVKMWIHKMNLRASASLPSGTYSSGNKQRLNIAIAMIGNPKLVLLDEPTIRVDPGARRSFWNTIKSCQASGQTVVLASHNMEECEALCNRMAIMVEGKVTCIGTPEELKQRFGAGYDVQIRIDPKTTVTQLDGIKNSMRLLLPCSLTNESSGSLMYYVSGPGTTWKRLYDVLNKVKNNYECVDDYIVIVRLSN